MAELWLLISAPSICPRSNSSISPTPSPLKMCDLDSILLAEHYWVLRYSDPVIRFALAHCLRDRLTIHEGTSRKMNSRSTTADLKRKLRRLIRSMDFASRREPTGQLSPFGP